MSVSGAIAATWLLANLLCVVAKDASNIHTVFVAGCNLHYQWQSLGVYHSHKKSGQPGPITRLLSCSERQTGLLKQRGDWDAWLEFGRTHLAPAYVDYRPSNNDSYRAYNKPLAIIHWLENAEPEEDWLLILDADQILHLPFVCKGEGHDEALRPFELECQRGSPISVHHPFLVGSTNELALKHLPGAQRRNDSEGGQPWGRYADQVGGVFLVHKEDLKLYMHDWLTLTEAVRDDPDAWNVAGDVSAQKPGHKVWIADLYGYVFAAAKHNVWHKIDPFAMGYPGAHSDAVMRVMHYTLTFNAVARTTAPTLLRSGSWSFFKHHHYSFETPLCPPWFSVPHPRHVKMVPKSISGVRSLAPSIKLLAVQEQTRLEDILAIETTNTLNEAFCARFESHCPAILDDAEFQLECGIVHDITEGIRQELLRMAAIPAGQPGAVCQGDEAACGSVTPEKCSRQFSHMAVMCPRACGIPCLPLLPPSQLSANNHSQVLEEAAVVPNPVATQASPRNPVSIDSTPSSSALSDPAPSNPSPGDSPSSSSPSVAEAMEAPSFNFTSPVYDQQW